MKIRWTKDSVRFRITPTELAGLERGERTEEALAGTGGGWQAVLLPDAEHTEIHFAQGKITLSLSEADLERLSLPDAEGVYFQTDGQSALRYYVEKDFPCIHPRAGEALEPTTESFVPPPGFEERKL